MSGPFISSTGRRRGGHRRLWTVLGAIGLVLAVLAAAFGVLWLLGKDEVPARTTIGGIPVGGLSEEAARARVEVAGAVRSRRPIRLVGPGGTAETTGAALGATPNVDEAVELALEPGALERVWRRIGIGRERAIPLTYALGPVRTAELANDLDRQFADPPRNGDLRVNGTDVRVVTAAPGTAVDRRALRRALVTLPPEVGLTLVDADPTVSTLEAEEARARVERLLAGPRVVSFQGVDATLWPRRTGELVRTVPVAGALAVRLDPDGLAAALRPRLGRFERAAQDASFRPVGKRVVVIPSRDGQALDGRRIGRSLVKNLDTEKHLARFTVARPDLTTREAKKLGIVEQISEFTTYHPCCAPRVNNIHRGAEILDGTIVLPGKRFSLNEEMGQRTEARGFVSAPQIFNGRLEDAVGGGVSQIATTMYNAAFFAGVQIITHQPHEFYISRYPMGREATVSWGGPELIWRNDWPAAIFIDTSFTDTSITIRFYSKKLGRRVTTVTGEPCCTVPPRTLTVSNSSLPPGTTQRRPGGRAFGLHHQLHAEGVPQGQAATERALHVALQGREQHRRGRPARPVPSDPEAQAEAGGRDGHEGRDGHDGNDDHGWLSGRAVSRRLRGRWARARVGDPGRRPRVTPRVRPRGAR